MMKGGEEEDEGTTTPSPTFYTLERQTRPNKETNKNKQSHLTGWSLFYHEERENNRTASLRSHAQQCLVILLSHVWESSGSPLTNRRQQPIALRTQLRRSHLSHSFITCLGVQVGRTDKELRQPMAVKACLSNLVIIYI